MKGLIVFLDTERRALMPPCHLKTRQPPNMRDAKIYRSRLSRFMQTDPMGYWDGLNLYGYAGGDAINSTDPSGLSSCRPTRDPDDIEVCGMSQPAPETVVPGGGSFGGGGASGNWETNENGGRAPATSEDIVVTGIRLIKPALPTSTVRPNRIFFGYPPERNASWHFDRHLPFYSRRDRRLLRQAIGNHIRTHFPRVPVGDRRIGFVQFGGREWQYLAFGLPGDITNVGTIRDVTE